MDKKDGLAGNAKAPDRQPAARSGRGMAVSLALLRLRSRAAQVTHRAPAFVALK
jgi:hypothetical protein